MRFCTENGRFMFFFRREIKVNQKPNISSCLTSSEAVMNYVWYQATYFIIAFQKCMFNCLIFQTVVALISTI